jgi:hypothetical protein
MVRAVTFCGVNEVDAAVRRRVENGVGVGRREIFSPFAAELPRADADDRDTKSGFAKNPIAHGLMLRPKSACAKPVRRYSHPAITSAGSGGFLI